MKKYNVTITDSDTYISRKIECEAENVYEAHKQVMMSHIVDYECEKIVQIDNEYGESVYVENQGFYEAN